MTGDSLAVAIDVGTTNSLVGVWENENVTYLKNDNGGRLIPSCVAFTDNECLVGESAMNQADSNAPNTIFGFTRLIGRKFSDLEVQKEIKTWPCKVICGPDNIPQVVVRFKGKKRAFYPVEIMAIILAHLRERVKVTMRKKVKNVVLIVPARFNHSQQQAMKDAGAIAGLNVIRLISGPTAASIAYGLERKDKAVQQTVLVYDLGGGTLDVSLVSVEGDIYEVLAIAGDAHFGGEDFDNCLVDHCVEEFKKVYQQDLRANERAMIRLRMACERIKVSLSTLTERSVDFSSIVDSLDLHPTITREQFETLCIDLFEKTLQPVQQVLSDANVMRSKVDEVLLVGGSTRIPRIKTILKDFFSGKSLRFDSVRSEEANIHGATVLAAMLTGRLSVLDEFMVLNVVPLSLWVEIDGKKSALMIPRNTTIPTKKSRTFSASEDGQSTARIQIFEGDSDKMNDNNPLGQLIVVDISPKPRQSSQIEVTLDIDANCILRVSVVDKATGTKKQVVVDIDSLSPSEIERISKNLGVNEPHNESKANLEKYANSGRSSAAKRIAELKREMNDMQAVEDEATETLRWAGSSRSTNSEEFDFKRRKLEDAAKQVSRNGSSTG